jgi:hypothetical protein
MANSFGEIVTGDELRFMHLYSSHLMFRTGRNNVIPREKPTIGRRKVMLAPRSV